MKSGSWWSYWEAGYFQDEPDEEVQVSYDPPETPEEYRSRCAFFGEGRHHSVVEQMILADGGLARVVRHERVHRSGSGLEYTFFHQKTAGDESPIIRTGLTEDEALNLYADALQADVMEVD